MSLRGQSQGTFQAVRTVEFLIVACGLTHFAIQADVVRNVNHPDESGVGALLAAVGITSSPMHLADLLDLDRSSHPAEPRTLVCGMQGRHFAFRVDQVLGLHDIDSHNIIALSPHFIGEERWWIAGMFLFRQTVALVLQTRWLFSEERASKPVLTAVLESAPRMQAPDSFQQQSAMDILTVQCEAREWTTMEFEEATDADDTPWAQI